MIMRPNITRPSLLAILTLLCLMVGHAGCSGPQTLPPTSKISMVPDTKVGPGDVFRVEVFGEKELSGKFRVSVTGTIDYPLVGSVQVDKLTPPQIANLLREKLADGYLREPFISVFVEEYASKKISVFGQVRKPGTFNYVSNMNIIEAITLAGGFTPLASKNKIVMTRTEGRQSRRFTVPVEDIGEGRAANYLLKPGDVLFIPERVF